MIKHSREWFLEQYFMYESVEEAIKSSDVNLPISNAQFHRLVVDAGIVKSPGKHVNLPEILHFFKLKALEPGMPIEKIYKKMPYDFKSSLATIHRVYKSVQNKAFRREGACLILFDQEGRVLVGSETENNSRYGKKVGDISLPMGFSKPGEADYYSALRIAQHEVSTTLAAKNKIDFIPRNIRPKMYFDLLDVRIKVYRIELPGEFRLKNCKSFRLVDHQFINIYELLAQENVRAGVKEIINKSLQSNEVIYEVSSLNKEIIRLSPAIESL